MSNEAAQNSHMTSNTKFNIETTALFNMYQSFILSLRRIEPYVKSTCEDQSLPCGSHFTLFQHHFPDCSPVFIFHQASVNCHIPCSGVWTSHPGWQAGCNDLTGINKITLEHNKLQMAGGQGSHQVQPFVIYVWPVLPIMVAVCNSLIQTASSRLLLLNEYFLYGTRTVLYFFYIPQENA